MIHQNPWSIFMVWLAISEHATHQGAAEIPTKAPSGWVAFCPVPPAVRSSMRMEQTSPTSYCTICTWSCFCSHLMVVNTSEKGLEQGQHLFSHQAHCWPAISAIPQNPKPRRNATAIIPSTLQWNDLQWDPQKGQTHHERICRGSKDVPREMFRSKHGNSGATKCCAALEIKSSISRSLVKWQPKPGKNK